MRAKTSDFLKVLNRARPEQKTTEKKTITYVYYYLIFILRLVDVQVILTETYMIRKCAHDRKLTVFINESN